MHQARARSLVGSLLLAVASAGCVESEIAAPDSAPNFAQAPLDPGRHIDFDERLVMLTDDLPGFGGMFMENGRLVVLQQGEAVDSDQVRERVREFLRSQMRNDDAGRGAGEAMSRRADDLVIRPARYDFRQLHSWYLTMKEALPGRYNWTDIDERRNKIEVGVETADLVPQYTEALRDATIPEDAFEVIHSPGSPTLTGDLTSTYSPRVGGLRIQPDWPTGWCSLGYNVEGPSDSFWYFLTVAHCTDGIGTVDSTTFGQPSTSPVIGKEYSDPPTFTNSVESRCDSGHDCRYSDVALIRYSASATHGTIAHPSVVNGTWGHTPSTSFTSTKRIGGTTDAAQGTIVRMVGSTSGRTIGEVLDTCIDLYIPAVDLEYICVHKADYPSRGGDSGAPVYDTIFPYTYPEIAVGIHFANFVDSLWSYFSIPSNYHQELENDVGGMYCESIWCSPPPRVTSITGPTTVPSFAQCEWEMHVSSGVPPYSRSWSGVASGSGSTLTAIISSSGNLWAEVTDAVNHSHSTSVYITVDNGAPMPPGCSL